VLLLKEMQKLKAENDNLEQRVKLLEDKLTN
jgi:cell division protein FtsB